ncbi:MAG: hypothetical protein U1D35_02420, partial [Paracoccaceae bacterium]|nr:hypothetical protein [Paracoccaceae bacterium]
EAVQPAQIVADGTAPTQTQATPRAGSGLVRAGAGKTKDPSPFKPVAAAAPAQISAQTSAQTDTIANPVVTQNPGGWRYSRLNPRNWFGRSRQTEVVAAAPVAGAPPRSNDPRPLVADVVNMAVEPMQGGAIVRATGLPQTQGWWNGALVALPVDDAGTLVFEFRLSAPVTQTAVSTPQSREVTVATFLSDFDLQGVSQIIVQGAQNARSSRR